jgi:hypothetical protein
MVSDNSTEAEELQELENFCAELGDDRLRYVRPPEQLSMPRHWQWAIEEVLQAYDASHFLYLTDRMMFKPMALKEVLDRAAVYSDKIISYNHDRIVDDARPIRIEQDTYTGDLLEIKTLRLSYLYSQSIFPHGLPRMLNCIVPRSVLNRIQQRFGNVFDSIAPDFLFCCRCLEVEDSILYYDKSPIFHYALSRSNGASVSRGEITPAHADFINNLPVANSRRNYATPIPQLITAANSIFNEYLIVKGETKSSRFFEIDFQKYLQVNAAEIKEVIDPQLRSEMRALLEAHGLREVNNGSSPGRSTTARARKLLSPKAVWNKLSSKVKVVMADQWTKPAWLLLSHLGIKPPDDNAFVFSELEEAIDYLKRFPRRVVNHQLQNEELLQARQLPFESQTQASS